MPRDHFWNKRSSKKEATLDGSKANGVTGNGDLPRDGGTSRKVGKTNSSGTGIKHLFGWAPIRRKHNGDDSKVPRSVSSSALSETRTLGFKRTTSNGEVEPSSSVGDYLFPVDRRLDQRQRHSSDRALQSKNSPQTSPQIYSLPADTIKKVHNGDNNTMNVVKSPSPMGVHKVRAPQQDYTEPWASTEVDGTIGTKSRAANIQHVKTGSTKKKGNVSPVSDNSLSPPSVSPEVVNSDVNNDDYEEPWDKYTGGMPPFRKKSKEKMTAGRISPKPPAKLPAELSRPPTEPIKPLLPLPPLLYSESDATTTTEPAVPVALPKRSISLKKPSVSDYSIPVDSKRMSDTTLPAVKTMDQCSSHGGSSSEELQSPSPPPPLPVRYVSAPIVNASLPLDQQPWYHHKMSRSEAEAVLEDKADFSFLVRESESSRDPYSLSIRNTLAGYMHLKIAYKNGMYIIGQFSKPFNTVPEAIEFYTRNKLTLKGAEHKQLKFPVHIINHM